MPISRYPYHEVYEFDLKEELKEGFVYFRKFDTAAFQKALKLQMEANKALNNLRKEFGIPFRRLKKNE